MPISEDRFLPEFNRVYEGLLRQVNHPNQLRGQVAKLLLKRLKITKDQIYYNDSKLLAELVSFVYSRLGVPVTVTRLVDCYGKNSTSPMNEIFLAKESMYNPHTQGDAISQLSELVSRSPIPRDYVYYSAGTIHGKDSGHDDVCRLIQAIAEKGESGQTYHLSSSGKFVRTPQSALCDAGLISEPWYKEMAHSMPDEKYRVFLDNAKLKTLNVSLPQTSPKQGIALLGSPTET